MWVAKIISMQGKSEIRYPDDQFKTEAEIRATLTDRNQKVISIIKNDEYIDVRTSIIRMELTL